MQTSGWAVGIYVPRKHRLWASNKQDTVKRWCHQGKGRVPFAENRLWKMRQAIISKWKDALAAEAFFTMTSNARKSIGRYTKKSAEIRVHRLHNHRQPRHLQREDQQLVTERSRNTVLWIQFTNSWLVDSKSLGRKEYPRKKPWRGHGMSFSDRRNTI